MIISRLRIFASWFHPFLFVMVMGSAMSATILFDFPYEARWLKICSYPMFGAAIIIFLYLQLMSIVHFIFYVKDRSLKGYINEEFRNVSRCTGWGTYPLGITTIINYLNSLAEHRIGSHVRAKRVMTMVYVLWWYNLTLALLSAWGISFLVWQKHYESPLGRLRTHHEKVMFQQLKSPLLLLVIPLIVVSSSSGFFTMSDLFTATFNRNIQLLTLVITFLAFFQALGFVSILFVLNFWDFYVNKLPAMMQSFTIFLFLGPMGQGAFGINSLTEDVRIYVVKYYNQNNEAIVNSENTVNLQRQILLLTVPWAFKIAGLLLSLMLLSFGFFFTVIGFVSISAHWKSVTELEIGNRVQRRRIWNFHRGWFAMTFPMGSMSLGTHRVWALYNDYVPMKTFRVLGAIYGAICIIWTILCLCCTFYQSVIPRLKRIGIYCYHLSSISSRHQINTPKEYCSSI